MHDRGGRYCIMLFGWWFHKSVYFQLYLPHPLAFVEGKPLEARVETLPTSQLWDTTLGYQNNPPRHHLHTGDGEGPV